MNPVQPGCGPICWQTLRDLPRGASAVVASIRPDGGPTSQRLLALGLLPGCRLTFMRNAPLGDPMMVETSTGVLCLRRRDAALVELEQKV